MKPEVTLRTRLVWVVLAAILPLFGLSLVGAVLNTNEAVSQASKNLAFSASLVAANQQKIADATRQTLVAIANTPGLQDGRVPACQRYFKTLRDQLPVYANLGIIELDGYVRCHSQSNSPTVFAGDRKYFQDALTRGAFVTGGYLINRATGKPIMTFALPMVNSQGKISAVAFATLYLTELAHVSDAPLPDGSRLLVADHFGIVLATNPEDPAAIGKPLASPLLLDALKAGVEGVREGPDKTGAQQIYAFLPSAKSVDAPFFVAISADRSVVVAPARQRLALALLAVMLVALLGSWMAWRMGGRAIVQPAAKILEATHQLAHGQLDVRVPIDALSPSGEFFLIADSFNLMADALQQRDRELAAELEISRRAYVTLEQLQLALLKSTERLQLTSEMAKVGGWELSLDDMLPIWSEQTFRIHEVDNEAEVDLSRAIEFYAPEAQSAIRAAVKSGIEHGTPWDLELPLITAKGRKIWVRAQGRAMKQDGKVVRLAGTFQDITQQRQSQEQMRLLQTCVANLNDMVLITEVEPSSEPGSRIVFVNPAFERHTGYSQDEVLGKSPHLLQGPKTQRAELDRIDAAMKQWHPVRAELINYTKSGKEFWVEIDLAPIADAAGHYTHWVGIERNISARKLAEQALVDSEQRFAALFEKAPVPMWVYDATSYKFLTVNHAAVQSYGFSVEEFLSMTLAAIRPESELAAMRQYLAQDQPPHRLQNVSKNLPLKRDVWLHRRKNGEVFSANVVSKPIQYAGLQARFVVALDLTAQVKAEKDVQEHLFTLQRAADAAQAITWHQSLNGMLQEVADQARGVIGAQQVSVSLNLDSTGMQTAHALSQSGEHGPYRSLATPHDGSGIYATVCKSNRAVRMTQAEIEAHPQWRGEGIDAAPHPLMRGWLAVPLQGRSGKNIGLLQLSDKYETGFTLEDEYVAIELAQLAAIAIENAQLLSEVSQLNAGLEQKVVARTAALRLSNQELEAFSYSVSHDLRSPLNTIDGFSRLLGKELPVEKGDAAGRQQHYLARIQAGVAQMGQLIEDLLSLAQVSRMQLHYGAIDLTAISQQILQEWQTRQPERRVQLHIDSGLQAQGDARLIKVMMENLLGNAWKFTSQKAEANIHVGQMRDATGSRVFFVRDDGAGFDMAYASKLFIAFQRLHTSLEFPGTGVGLATVSRVVGRHGGLLWAEAELGLGATFFFTLAETATII